MKAVAKKPGSRSVAVKSKAKKPARAGKTVELKPKSKGVGGIILTSISVGVAGVLGYFGWQYYKKTKAQKAEEKLNKDLENLEPPPPEKPKKTKSPKVDYSNDAESSGTKTGSSASSGFPLKKGSKGELVRQLQQALIDKYGGGVLPKYGADGDFGSETQTALKKYGFPTVVTESIYKFISQGSSSSNSGDASGLAKKLYDAAASKDVTGMITLLKTIKSKDQYQQVSTGFMQYFLRGVRQTLVNGMLSSAGRESDKQKIRMEFIRMGLQYNGDKWSLSGFGGKTVVTTEPSRIWVNSRESLQAPANMVLGNEVTKRLDYTLFENNKKYFLVRTQSVRYLE